MNQIEELLSRTCDNCFHTIKNELGYWCLRYSIYTFPDKGMGRNCTAFMSHKKAEEMKKDAFIKMCV